MDSETVYLLINDWIPRENEERFLRDYQIDTLSHERLREEGIGVVIEVIDCSLNYYLTAKRSWLGENYSELLGYISRRFPEHTDQHGLYFITPDQ